jgi:hypothetical protein
MDFEGGQKITIPLEPDPHYQGEVKSLGDKHFAQHSASDFEIAAFVVHSVHGYLDGPQSTPASLVVIRFELSNESTSTSERRFRSFIPELRFQKDPKGDPREDPWVELCEPAGKGAIAITETYSDVTKDTNYEISAGVQWQPAPVQATAKLGGSESQTYRKKAQYTISVGRRKTQVDGGGRLGQDVVRWNSREDAIEKLGVGDQLRVAILVCRTGPSPFNVHFDFKAHVDLRYYVARNWQDWKPFHSKNTMSYPFDPNRTIGNVPNGVDPNHLANLNEGNALSKLAFVHVVEKVSAKKFYSGSDDGEAAGPATT